MGVRPMAGCSPNRMGKMPVPPPTIDTLERPTQIKRDL